ncbi:casein kinase 2 regulatory subunit CKB2 [Ascoidea rubescens DSM 1968]|uniref:Casein kinase II subunit beta n=1 Tax=Ascoidea rubescens DSM 1968 TaxID=1344418 RepID=A0A1D2VL05_9ASCO|nr:regulatory subunit of casein kinase 2 [Ascoidea rubescens DSM 1968]ODV62237.1 regulatory subunit of casein kinase 2 [Ascoidea rubescens DSM 1968]
MNLTSVSSGSDFSEYWVDSFLETKGNEYFCDIDIEYITDRFNLTGLNNEVDRISYVIDIITDNSPKRNPREFQRIREQMEAQARYLYGLIHARYIITSRGLQKMLDKYRNGDFGYCQRVYCDLQPLLPIGLNDQPKLQPVKLYCPTCEDIYNPKSSRHGQIDGAFFGTSFPGMFFQTFPNLVPPHPTKRYIPRVFGFQLHEQAKLARWQILQRKKLEKKLLQNHIDIASGPGSYIYDEEDEQEAAGNEGYNKGSVKGLPPPMEGLQNTRA